MVTVLGDGWPRDFTAALEPDAGMMFLGTALHWINKAINAKDADDDDILLPKAFVDRLDRDNPNQLESFETQRWAFLRAEHCRELMSSWLRRGDVAAYWLDSAGRFQPIRKTVWGKSPRSARVMGFRRRSNGNRALADAALRRFGLPTAYFRLGPEDAEPSGRRFIYVRPDQLLQQLTMVNPLARRFLYRPEKSLHKFCHGQDVAEQINLLGALVWIATRDLTATIGALEYPARYKHALPKATQQSACHAYLQDQIRDYWCRCRQPICRCWVEALEALKKKAGGENPSLSARGYRDDRGDEEVIPAPAWKGAPSYDSTCWLEPPRPGGTRWGSVTFTTDHLIREFPAAASELAPKLQFDRQAALHEVAAALKRDGIRKGKLRAPHIADRWPHDGGDPPGLKEVMPLMENGQRGRPPEK